MVILHRVRSLAPLLVLLVTAPGLAPQQIESAVEDSWSPIIGWSSESGQTTAAVHATLMRDGRILLFGVDSPFGYLMSPPAVDAAPAQVTMAGFRTPVEFPEPGIPFGAFSNVRDTLYCAGHTPMSDGSLFVAGGTRTLSVAVPLQTHYVGLNYAAVLGVTPATWFRIPQKMIGTGELGAAERWYPQVTRLPDGRLLVTAGADYIVPPSATSTNRSVEIYTPGAFGSAAWTLVSTHAQSPPEIYNIDYSHVFPLPEKLHGKFDVMMIGELGKPTFLSLAAPAGERWLVSDQVRPGILPAGAVPTITGHHGKVTVQALPARGPNYLASSVMLPLRVNNASGEAGYHNGSMLSVGGNPNSTYAHTVDVYDPVRDKWIAQVETGVIRHHPSTVLLPDGRILIVAGHSDLPEGDPGVGKAQYLDPRAGFALSEGTAYMPEVRGYHTVTLLLPDGRVLVGGGNPDNAAFQERDNFRFYYPDYMTKPRPHIALNPPTITLGSRFGLQWKGATEVTEVVLMALGSMTHSFDSSQRSIELPITRRMANGVLDVRSPANAEWASPGYYMLFVVDANRVPSVGKIIKVEAAP